MSEETVWDKWKRQQEADEGVVPFHSFNVYRYVFTKGDRKGKHAFDLCGPYEDGSWTVEPQFADDIRFSSTDEVIDFMLSLKLGPPANPAPENT